MCVRLCAFVCVLFIPKPEKSTSSRLLSVSVFNVNTGNGLEEPSPVSRKSRSAAVCLKPVRLHLEQPLVHDEDDEDDDVYVLENVNFSFVTAGFSTACGKK